MSDDWYQRVPMADGTVMGGEQNCGPRWDVMTRLHGDLRGLRVLEIGPAEGFFSMECADRGAHVTAVEKDAKMQQKFRLVRKARGHLAKNVKLVTADTAVFLITAKSACYDVVMSLNVLHHLHGPLQHLWDLSRVLAADGVLYLEVPKKTKDLIRFKRDKSFYVGLSLVDMILSKWFREHRVVLDWKNSVGNERVLYEARK